MKYLYAQSKLLVQPSYYEGFGMPPLEALTVGTQAIISDIPVFKEIYGSLPVTFFKTGDSGDLAEKLLAKNKEISDTKKIDLSSIEELYSYKRSAKIICDTLATFKK